MQSHRSCQSPPLVLPFLIKFPLPLYSISTLSCVILHFTLQLHHLPFSRTSLFYDPSLNSLSSHPSFLLPLFLLFLSLASLLFLSLVIWGFSNSSFWMFFVKDVGVGSEGECEWVSRDHPPCRSWDISHTGILPWATVSQQQAVPTHAGISKRSPPTWSLKGKSIIAIDIPAASWSSFIPSMKEHCLNIIGLVWHLESLPGALLLFPDLFLPHHVTWDTFLLFS